MFSILITATFAITYALQWVIPLFHRQERLHKTLLTIQPYIFWAMFTGTIILTWRIILRTPTLTLFILTPALIYLLIIALLTAARRQQYRRTGRSRRARQKTEEKEGLALLAATYPTTTLQWIKTIIIGWDKPRWAFIHITLITTANLTAANLSWTGLLTAYALAGGSLARYFWLRHKQGKQKEDFYKFLSTNKIIDKDTPLHKAVSVTWGRDMLTPAIIRLSYGMSYKVQESKVRVETEKAFDAKFWIDESYKFIWDYRNKQLVVSTVDLPTDLRWDGKLHEDPFTFILGVDLRTGKPVTFSVKSENPHFIVGGGTGSGKSEVIYTIVAQAILKDWYIVLADPKMSGLVDFSRKRRYSNRNGINTGFAPLLIGDARPGIIAHATDIVGCGDVLDKVLDEMEYRKRLCAEYNKTNVSKLPQEVLDGLDGAPPIKPMLVIVDEITSFFLRETIPNNAPPEKREILETIMEARGTGEVALNRLVMEARAFNIFIGTAAQSPSVENIGSNFRKQLGLRVGMGGLESGNEKMLFGSEKPPALTTEDKNTEQKIPGRGRFKPDQSLPTRTLQAYWCGPDATDLDKYCPFTEAPAIEMPVEMPETFLQGTPWQYTKPAGDVSTVKPKKAAKSPRTVPATQNTQLAVATTTEPTNWEGSTDQENPVLDIDTQLWQKHQENFSNPPEDDPHDDWV